MIKTWLIRKNTDVPINKRLIHAFGIIIILMLTSSCCHKRFHCEESEADVLLTINLCVDEYQAFTRSDANSRSVFICVEGEGQRLEYSLIANKPKITLPLKLEPGKYTVYVWVEDCARCRNMSILPYVALKEVSEYRKTCDAQGGSIQMQAVCGYQEVSMSLKRPLAKIRLVAEDAIDKDFTGLSATVYYAGFFPTMFNINSFLPCDAATGYSFTNPIDSEVIGEDFIFADIEETFVKVNITIKNQSGEIIASTTNIMVPYRRGQVTTVKGKFLTNQSSGNGGIYIDNEWSGEYEVEFQ